MKERFIYWYIVLVVVFADTYIGLPWIKMSTILNYFILIFILFKPNLLYKSFEVKKSFYFLLIFLFYLFFNNLFKNDLKESFSLFLSSLPLPFILVYFNVAFDSFKYVHFYAVFYLLYSSFFSFLQLGGLAISSSNLLATLPLIDVERDFQGFTTQGLRVTGTDINSIAYSCILGMLVIYFFNLYSFSKSKQILFFLCLSVFMMFLTQSRATLFSIVPVIFLSNLFLKNSGKKIFSVVILSVIVFSIINVFLLPVLQETFPRLFLSIEEDGSVIHRIQANVYSAVGTFFLNPFFGVSFSNADAALNLGYEKLGLFVGTYFIDEVTHHNQLFYFFRYYGFVGLFLFIYVYFSFLKIGLKSTNYDFIKKTIIGIVLFHFLYTLTHNNKITMDYYLYIFLSLNSNSMYIYKYLKL